ncbi:LOW QUALITY PROTEIN: inactive ubiquitin carboxyl-terminal hydrolase MINDY-4B [Megalobrama amblycephala]|uniref:LOW QUALITY PROTEIN: inactive ubiquitin carboxyl-terminal hydrolase MINDY-4B n=1 Tax=Megalobrama amblycephala TaxID=75352 RepID=UPI0020141101|nr:LOW QUALITY PROTEIN: inactive ubiquitin carboxyl-terminal hydrolase MINDY-4B [Megalobrama amblycephala]
MKSSSRSRNWTNGEKYLTPAGWNYNTAMLNTEHVKPVMTDYQDLLQTIKSLQHSRLSYIELLQEEVKRSQDRPSEKIKADEDSDDSRPATSAHHVSASNKQFTVPYSIPQTLAVSPSLGGQPVSPELAVSLRKILFGNTFHIFNYEWKKSFFKFREPFSDLAYALETERGGAKCIQMVVQAHIIKYLLFNRPVNSACTMQSMVEVGEKEQRRALAAALADILWTAGEEQTATISLVTSERCFTPHLDYKLDSFTERLQLFTFKKKDDVRSFICEHIQCFKEEGSHGIILFLYSLIFSRTIDRIRADFDCTTTHLLHLSLGNFVCRQALLNLLLTGRATPHVFNGTSFNDEKDKPLAHPLHGVLTRSHVGYLLWNREQVKRAQLPLVGSMLKTPKLPIWVCNINGTYSVLFSPNRSLLSDWKMEHLFQLYFYNGQPTQLNTTVLTIDTHSHHWEAENNDIQGDLEKKFPSVEMTIRTKWEGAVIDWNGTVPFF